MLIKRSEFWLCWSFKCVLKLEMYNCAAFKFGKFKTQPYFSYTCSKPDSGLTCSPKPLISLKHKPHKKGECNFAALVGKVHLIFTVPLD